MTTKNLLTAISSAKVDDERGRQYPRFDALFGFDEPIQHDRTNPATEE